MAEQWKLVPIEPTDNMTFVGQSHRYDAVWSIGAIYREMIAAAPTQGADERIAELERMISGERGLKEIWKQRAEEWCAQATQGADARPVAIYQKAVDTNLGIWKDTTQGLYNGVGRDHRRIVYATRDAVERAARATAEPSPMHVGDSKFEEWFARHPTGQHMPKQFGRDAYEAGLNERATAEQSEPVAILEHVWNILMDQKQPHLAVRMNDALKVLDDALKSQQDAAIESKQAEQSAWQPIETAPKTGRALLLGYLNSLGNWRTVRGEWLTQEYIDQNWEEPDEAEAGWYETSVEADDVPSCWPITPTHWQPMPKPPADAAIESQRSEGESS